MAGLPPPPDDDDPPPPAPVLPDLDECCGQGCDPCIFDLHDAAQERYRAALRAWEERRRARAGDAAPDGPGPPPGARPG